MQISCNSIEDYIVSCDNILKNNFKHMAAITAISLSLILAGQWKIYEFFECSHKSSR